MVDIRVKRKNSEFKNIEFHETILAAKQKFFFTKVDPPKNHN